VAINWEDDDILMMGSTLGRKLRHHRKTDLDDVTLSKLAVWFMNNYEEFSELYYESDKLINYMDTDDSPFLKSTYSTKPSKVFYESSLELMNPVDYGLNHYGGAAVESYQALKDNPSKSRLFEIQRQMSKFHYRILQIYSSGHWVKSNPLAQRLWFFRTHILVLFATIKLSVMLWYLQHRVSMENPLASETNWTWQEKTRRYSRSSGSYRSLIRNYVDGWFQQYNILIDSGDEYLREYLNDYDNVERRRLYRRWGVDPSLLKDQKEFIKSLSLLIRRGMSARDRYATTFQDERYNTANELKALVQTGWSPELPEVDYQLCSNCDGLGYHQPQSVRSKRKCTVCQGWGSVGEHIWLHPKRHNTGRYSKTPEIAYKDRYAEAKRRRFDRLVSKFKSECVGNYK